MKITTIEKLKKQRALLDARIQAIQSRHKVSERKKDTRRKILVGAYYLEKAHQNNEWNEVKKLMDTYLTRNIDRVLFDLIQTKSPSAIQTQYGGVDNKK